MNTDELAQRRRVAASLERHQQTRSLQLLCGLLMGLTADGVLNDAEISMLRVWLDEHPEAASIWPGSAVSFALTQALADGVITAEERTHILQTIQAIVDSDFVDTGAVTPTPTSLPVDDSVALAFQGAGIAFTGTFHFGTRAKCERLAKAAGAIPTDTVSRKTHILVIGSQVTPNWLTETYGRKIMAAAELRSTGHPIAIVTERHWLSHLTHLADA